MGTVDYGDGRGQQSLALDPGKTFTLINVYPDDGNYIVNVTVSDSHGGVGSHSLTVVVNSVEPEVDAGSNRVEVLVVGLLCDAETGQLDWDDSTRARVR